MIEIIILFLINTLAWQLTRDFLINNAYMINKIAAAPPLPNLFEDRKKQGGEREKEIRILEMLKPMNYHLEQIINIVSAALSINGPASNIEFRWRM